MKTFLCGPTRKGRDRIGNAFFFVPDSLQLCGVDFEVKNFFAENLNEKIPKRYFLGVPQILALRLYHRPCS